MPRYEVSVYQDSIYANIRVRAPNPAAARVTAMLPSSLNDADWKISDGNVIDPENVSISGVEEIKD
jgi:hypothetical protein